MQKTFCWCHGPTEDEKSGRDLQQYQSQAKQLFRKLNDQSPDRCTLEAKDMSFHYVIADGVCYLSLCEPSFPKKMAFAYLEDLHGEFSDQYGHKTRTSRKAKSRTLTAGRGGTWVVSIQSYRMFKESWWQILKKFYNVEKHCLPWTPKPAICPRCRRSTAATPSTSTPAPRTPKLPPWLSFSSRSSSTCASGGSDGVLPVYRRALNTLVVT
ncbi:vesicle-trafficking protein SEC22b-A isoform X3 [Corythoichthys intestinalis]|uniref:vesicle-trafficking protein SEC22b-A isoform X3 n=1 Tax=Corythoichthys intestinalis TaxID=161448 RepID=UPI0025A54CFD|nr:vesicle-trafficking protein SEC22b-A isoform X3 [Corythoichthys intestinalis]